MRRRSTGRGGPAASSASGTEAAPGRAESGGRSRAIFFARLAVGLGLLAFLLLRLDFSTVTIGGPAAQASGVAAVAGLMILAQMASAVRWRLIMGAGAPGALYLFRLYLIGNFFSLFLPSSIGGDAVRTVAAARATGKGATTVSSVVADRLAGVTALVVYLAAGSILAPSLLDRVRGEVSLSGSPALVGLGVALALLGLLGGVLLLPKIRPMLEQAASVFVDLARAPARLLAVAILALAVQGLYIIAWWALGAILGLGVEATTYLFTVPVVSLVAMLPVTLSGLGVREGAWLILLGPLGVASPDAVAFSLLFFVAFTLVGALGGILFALRGTEPPVSGAEGVESEMVGSDERAQVP